MAPHGDVFDNNELFHGYIQFHSTGSVKSSTHNFSSGCRMGWDVSRNYGAPGCMIPGGELRSNEIWSDSHRCYLFLEFLDGISLVSRRPKMPVLFISSLILEIQPRE